LPEVVREHLGIKEEDGSFYDDEMSLVFLNDKLVTNWTTDNRQEYAHENTFKDIADLIESAPKGLFKE
jgi:hypothetical protein